MNCPSCGASSNNPVNCDYCGTLIGDPPPLNKQNNILETAERLETIIDNASLQKHKSKTESKEKSKLFELFIKQIISKPFRWLFIAALLVLIIYRFFENIFK